MTTAAVMYRPDDVRAGDRVYKRGALTLHALRLTVGDGAFFDILRTWTREHRGGTVTTVDFVTLAEAVSGMPLGALFEQWLNRRALPALPASHPSSR